MSYYEHEQELMKANIDEKEEEFNEIKQKFKKYAQTSEDTQQKWLKMKHEHEKLIDAIDKGLKSKNQQLIDSINRRNK